MLTQERLKNLLSYDPNTGIFIWRETRNQLSRRGSTAGTTKDDGYIHIKIDGQKYFAHRLVFLYETGEFPPNQVDHINHKNADNRRENLRLCTQSQNQGNSIVRSSSNSGYKGVSWYKDYNKWMAHIQRNNKRTTLGYFNCKHEAAKEYNKRAEEFWGEFACLNQISTDH